MPIMMAMMSRHRILLWNEGVSKRKSGQDVHGLILLDKRIGLSSNRALQEVRRLLNANKAGHTGSLDPLATGLLPLCFGEATKVSALLLDDHKRYEVTIQLGIVTDTGDAEGKVLATRPVPKLSEVGLKHCLQRFVGRIEQVPPMYSALKYNGRCLYQLAREGQQVERKARQVDIFEINLQGQTEQQLYLEVFCSKGTYIRTLAEDIGNDLGCGGTVTALRRTQAGQFDIKEAWRIEQLQALSPKALTTLLMPMDAPLTFLPEVQLTTSQGNKIRLGQRIEFSGIEPGLVKLYAEQCFLGLGEMRNDGKLAPKRLLGESQA